MALLLTTGQVFGGAEPPSPEKAAFAKRAQKAYETAKARFESETNNVVAQWQFGRACFDWAEMAASDSQRIEVAQQGVAACRTLVAADPKSAPGHYYLAMNLGEIANAKRGLEGLKLVGQMESEFKLVLGLDAGIDFGGPDRNLGLLYEDAPGWPISVGSKSKARQHLQEALKRAPDYPENHLNLIEAELKWNDKAGAVRDLKALDEIWDSARKKLSGEEWASSWADWGKRRDDARKKADAPQKIAAPPRK